MPWHRGLHHLESHSKYLDDLQEFEVSAGGIPALWLYKTFHETLVPLPSYMASTYFVGEGVARANLIYIATKYFFLLRLIDDDSFVVKGAAAGATGAPQD
jgi:hypothetical protein